MNRRTGRGTVEAGAVVGAALAAALLIPAVAPGSTPPGGPASVPPPDTVVLTEGARSPDVSVDGVVAFSLLGDLWTVRLDAPGAARRVTATASRDGDPAWGPEGRWLYFASGHRGRVDLWRVERRGDGSFGEPERVTDTPDRDEREPAVAADGRVAFRSGTGRQSDLWLRTPDGEERRLTDGAGGDRSPAFSPDGSRLVYVATRADGRSLRLLGLEENGAAPETVLEVPRAAHPAWSPDGTLIAYASAEAPGEVGLTDPEGTFTNRITGMRAHPSWAPDGESLVAAELPLPGPRYNGDPERLGPRAEQDVFPEAGRIVRVAVGSRPDAAPAALEFAAHVPRAEFNRRVFRQVADRIEGLYFAGDDDTELPTAWDAHRAGVREKALAAETRSSLRRAVHRLVRERPPTHRPASGRAAVSSAHPRATEAGLEVLRKGGNVVDAAVAISFALGVVEPDASGIGGYGEMLIHLEGMDGPVAIEFLTRVPQAATLENGRLTGPNGDALEHGPAAANVPGTVAGMEKAWERYGSGEVAWAELLAPAIEIAAQGFVLDEVLPTTLRRREEELSRYRGSRELFFEDGEPLAAGDTLRNPDLAWTLRRIAENGADTFYEGEVAERIVEDLRGKGNAMTRRDLARYWAAERQPVTGTYRGHTVYGSAPATTGGATLVGKLHLLDRYASPGAYPEDAGTLHAMIEAWKLAPETDGRIADPGLWPVNRTPFVSRDTARARWRCFDPERAIVEVVDLSEAGPASAGTDECARGVGVETAGPGATAGSGSGPDRSGLGPDAAGSDEPSHPAVAPHLPRIDGTREGTGTTGFAVADGEGNMVAVTQTLGTWGGSFYVTPGLGFLYNDKLGSYGSDPGEYNARLPFARNRTSISPTLVFSGSGPDRDPLLATGAGGNAWITSAVYQIVAGVVDRGLGPQQALEQPRFLVGRAPVGGDDMRPLVQYEDALSPSVVRELRSMGHRLQPISLRGELRMGYAAAVRIDDSGRAVAGADPRRSGSAGALP